MAAKLTDEARCVNLFYDALDPEGLLAIAKQIVVKRRPDKKETKPRKPRSDKGKAHNPQPEVQA
jgi:hypothetical protein